MQEQYEAELLNHKIIFVIYGHNHQKENRKVVEDLVLNLGI